MFEIYCTKPLCRFGNYSHTFEFYSISYKISRALLTSLTIIQLSTCEDLLLGDHSLNIYYMTLIYLSKSFFSVPINSPKAKLFIREWKVKTNRHWTSFIFFNVFKKNPQLVIPFWHIFKQTLSFLFLLPKQPPSIKPQWSPTTFSKPDVLYKQIEHEEDERAVESLIVNLSRTSKQFRQEKPLKQGLAIEIRRVLTQQKHPFDATFDNLIRNRATLRDLFSFWGNSFSISSEIRRKEPFGVKNSWVADRDV